MSPSPPAVDDAIPADWPRPVHPCQWAECRRCLGNREVFGVAGESFPCPRCRGIGWTEELVM